MKRSAIALARGARTGVRMMRMSAPANTASKAAVNLLSRSRIRNRNLVGAVAEVHEQVAGLLGDPGAGGVGGDPGDVHAAAAVLDHDEDVEAAQEDGVDVGEVDGEDRVGLRGQELSPGRAGPSRGGVEAGGLVTRGPGGHGGSRAVRPVGARRWAPRFLRRGPMCVTVAPERTGRTS